MSNRTYKNSFAKVSRDDQGEPMYDSYEEPETNDFHSDCNVCDQLDICRCNSVYEASPNQEISDEDRMQAVLQELANQDRIQVTRSSEGHSTIMYSADLSTTVTVGGWLIGQDMSQGWIQQYSLWTEEADDNCIRIRLMIETDVVPDLPEFHGCSNESLCNLDYFHNFTICIKRYCVIDQAEPIHADIQLLSRDSATDDLLNTFIASHQRGLFRTLYNAIDQQKKDNVRYFTETIVSTHPTKISDIFNEIISRVCFDTNLRKMFVSEYIFPILQYVLDNGADINHPNVWGNTPLMTSISFKTIEMQLFIMSVPSCNLNYTNYKSNVNYDVTPMTPLLLAITHNYTDGILTLILDPRTSVHLATSTYTPLTFAQKMKNDIIVQALLEHGA